MKCLLSQLQIIKHTSSIENKDFYISDILNENDVNIQLQQLKNIQIHQIPQILSSNFSQYFKLLIDNFPATSKQLFYLSFYIEVPIDQFLENFFISDLKYQTSLLTLLTYFSQDVSNFIERAYVMFPNHFDALCHLSFLCAKNFKSNVFNIFLPFIKTQKQCQMALASMLYTNEINLEFVFSNLTEKLAISVLFQQLDDFIQLFKYKTEIKMMFKSDETNLKRFAFEFTFIIAENGGKIDPETIECIKTSISTLDVSQKRMDEFLQIVGQ